MDDFRTAATIRRETSDCEDIVTFKNYWVKWEEVLCEPFLMCKP